MKPKAQVIVPAYKQVVEIWDVKMRKSHHFRFRVRKFHYPTQKRNPFALLEFVFFLDEESAVLK